MMHWHGDLAWRKIVTHDDDQEHTQSRHAEPSVNSKNPALGFIDP